MTSIIDRCCFIMYYRLILVVVFRLIYFFAVLLAKVFDELHG